MRRAVGSQAERRLIAAILLVGCLLGFSSASGEPYPADYIPIEAGTCVNSSTSSAALWRETVERLREGELAGAMTTAQSLVDQCPNDPYARHLAALCAWAVGERSLAARWLVAAYRADTNLSMAAIALAALNADPATEAAALGWLRRGLARASAGERAYWLTRPPFRPLWQMASDRWRARLREWGVPEDLEKARALATPPGRSRDAPAAGTAWP